MHHIEHLESLEQEVEAAALTIMFVLFPLNQGHLQFKRVKNVILSLNRFVLLTYLCDHEFQQDVEEDSREICVWRSPSLTALGRDQWTDLRGIHWSILNIYAQIRRYLLFSYGINCMPLFFYIIIITCYQKTPPVCPAS